MSLGDPCLGEFDGDGDGATALDVGQSQKFGAWVVAMPSMRSGRSVSSPRISASHSPWIRR